MAVQRFLYLSLLVQTQIFPDFLPYRCPLYATIGKPRFDLVIFANTSYPVMKETKLAMEIDDLSSKLPIEVTNLKQRDFQQKNVFFCK